MEQLVECRSRTADKLVVLAECKPRPADKLDGLAEHESRVAGELLVAAIDCSAKESGSDFLSWHSPRELADGSRAAGKFALFVKGCLEALHPNPFDWLVRELVSDLVHSFICSLVAVIESNDLPELDLQQPS